MGKETRRNNVYYYRKKREGKRVISEYVGSGDLAELIDITTRLEQNHRQARRAEIQARQASADRINAPVDKHSAMVSQLVEAHLLELGYHKHNRQWRLRRG